MTALRRDPASLKVISFGLSRTGTLSLRTALETLGFGPCYHYQEIMTTKGRDFPNWFKIGDGEGTPETFDDILRNYGSAVDCPVALYPAELYAAYPDAKFILTTRDPAAWEKSVKATVLRVNEFFDPKPVKTYFEKNMLHWQNKYFLEKYLCGRLDTHAQQLFREHNERVKKIIPAEKLLVYEVSEGWDRLVEFLGVPRPTVPFPHLNDSATFQETVSKMGRNNER